MSALLRSLASAVSADGSEKVVLWVRHGHAFGNAAIETALAASRDGGRSPKDVNLSDPPLTATGRAQAEALQRRLRGLQLPAPPAPPRTPGGGVSGEGAGTGVGIELVAVSPLRRALETAALALPGAPLCVVEALRERHSGRPDDGRASREEIVAFLAGGPCAGADLSCLDGDADPMPPASREPFSAAEARGRRVLDWLMGRPERSIAVVSHEWMLQRAIFGRGCSSVLRVERPPHQPGPDVGALAFGHCKVRAFAMRRAPGARGGGRGRIVARPVSVFAE